MNKYNLVYKRDNTDINISTDKELDEHLKRHLTAMVLNNKSINHIYKWLNVRGYRVSIDSSINK